MAFRPDKRDAHPTPPTGPAKEVRVYVTRGDDSIEVVTVTLPPEHQSSLGVSACGPVYLHKVHSNPVYEARVAVAIIGHNPPSRTLNPFKEKFAGNYCHGRGVTKEDAVLRMLIDMAKNSDILWSV